MLDSPAGRTGTSATERKPRDKRNAGAAAVMLACIVLAGVILALPLLSAGCRPVVKKAAIYPITAKDDTGRKVTVKNEPKRIVSLAPDNTETLFALGLADRVVGVTTYCNYPPEAKGKAKIGDLMNPNVEKIIALKPDLVLATGAIQKPVIGQLEKLDIPVFITFPTDYAGVLRDIRAVGRLTNRQAAASKIITSMTRKRDDIAAKVKGERRPKVFYEVYKEPLMTAGPGTFIDDIIRLAGGDNVAVKAQKQYPEYSLEMLVAQNPDVYLASSGTMGSPGELNKRPGWAKLAAVKSGRVYIIDQDIISRGGPRLADALETVAKALHP